MEPAAALAEAIKQFESQGVDLKNIDISGGVGKVEMDKALSSLKIFAKNNVAFSAHTNSDVEQYNTSQQVSILKELLDYCDAKCEQRSRNREMMNPEGLNALLELLIPEQNDEVLVSTMTLLTSLVKNEVELRDFFEPGGSLRLSKILSFQFIPDSLFLQQQSMIFHSPFFVFFFFQSFFFFCVNSSLPFPLFLFLPMFNS